MFQRIRYTLTKSLLFTGFLETERLKIRNLLETLFIKYFSLKLYYVLVHCSCPKNQELLLLNEIDGHFTFYVQIFIDPNKEYENSMKLKPIQVPRHVSYSYDSTLLGKYFI
jgi:hypothetical protein